MTIATSFDIGSVGSIGGPTACPPRILRENMAMAREDRIEAEIPDNALETWWSWHDAEGCAPVWSLFKPFENPRWLPHIIVYEIVGGRIRCSLMGETVSSRLPLKMAGRFIDEVMPAENLDDISARMEQALETGLPNFVEKTMAWRIGYDLTSYRSLQLPFRGDNGKNPRIISVMNFQVERA